jgi:hypothetical protein
MLSIIVGSYSLRNARAQFPRKAASGTRIPIPGGKGSPDTLVQFSVMLLWPVLFFRLCRSKSALKRSIRRPKEHTTTLRDDRVSFAFDLERVASLVRLSERN